MLKFKITIPSDLRFKNRLINVQGLTYKCVLKNFFPRNNISPYKEMECTYIYYTYVFESDNWSVHVQSRIH